MGLILDTVAIIRWVEHGDERITAEIESTDDDLLVHLATIGELHAGVLLGTTPDERAARRSALAVATDELGSVAPTREHAACWGALTARFGRRLLGQNDRWIAAAACVADHRVLTCDRGINAVLVERLPAAPEWQWHVPTVAFVEQT